jgi:DNA-binding NarL/FixJ family response regulator
MVATTVDTADFKLRSAEIGSRRLLVVDDHAVVHMGLRSLLGRQDWVQRYLPAFNAEQAVALTTRYEPHLALVDVFIGAESGLDVCREVKRVRPDMEILLMSGQDRISTGVARAAGAIGFVSKSWTPATILEAVHRAACGKLVFETGDAPHSRLTQREMDVLRQIAIGASNPEAAVALKLSHHTVKQHTSSLYKKLEARNRTDAVRCAQRLGLIS